MNSMFSTWLMVAYGLSVLGYLGRFMEGIPRIGILIGMAMISTAYGCMFLSKVLPHKEEEHAKKDDDEKDSAPKKNWSKIFAIVGYSLASLFFFSIHFIPQLTFTVRYYDIFGAIGYGTAAVGTAFLPLLLPVGYAITAIYYVCGSYQKLNESEWIGYIQLISRTILAVIYGVTSLSHTNLQIF